MNIRPRQEPVDWVTVDKAIHSWIVDITAIESKRVVKAKSDPDQPAYPYATFLRTAVGGDGSLPEKSHRFLGTKEPEGQEIEITIFENQEFTLQIQTFANRKTGKSDPGADAIFLANRLRASLGLPSICDAFDAIGLVWIERLPCLDISEVVNQKFDSRASLDIRFRIASVMTERMGYIDKAELNRKDPDTDETLQTILVDAS